MLELKVTVDAPELAVAMTTLAAALNGAKIKDYAPIQTGAPAIPAPAPPVFVPPAQLINPPAGVTTPTAPVVTPPVPTTPPQAPIAPPASNTAVPVANAPQYSRDQIMTAGAALIDAGKMNELMGLLNSFGIQAVTQLKQEQLGAFATELRKLGAQI